MENGGEILLHREKTVKIIKMKFMSATRCVITKMFKTNSIFWTEQCLDRKLQIRKIASV